jgi:hypothetical protein
MAFGLAIGVTTVAGASVQTDRWLYAQGDTVQITGDEMLPGEAVVVDVFLPDGSLSQSHEVVADDGGAFSDTYTLASDAPGGIYDVVATGAVSGSVFRTQFDPLQWDVTFPDPTDTQYSDVAALGGAVTCRVTGGGTNPPTCPTDLSNSTVTAKRGAGFNTTIGSDTSDSDGVWGVNWQVNVIPSTTDYTMKAYASGGELPAGTTESDNSHILVTKENTVTTYTGDTSGTPGGSLALDATVEDEDSSFFASDPNLAGTVTFQLYSDAGGTTPEGSSVNRTLTAGDVQSGGNYTLPTTPGTYYMKASYGGNDYYNSDDSPLVAISVGSSCTFSGILPPVNDVSSAAATNLSSYKLNARGVVPIKFQLTCGGDLVDTQAEADAHPMTLALVQVNSSDTQVGNDTLEDPSAGSANTGYNFRFDDSADQYIYNRTIKGLAAGIWRVTATTGSDSTNEWFKIVG